MDIGRAILEIRKEKGLKLETVALDADTETGYLSRIENGKRRPSLEMLEKLAIALGSSVTGIVQRAEDIDGDGLKNKSELAPPSLHQLAQVQRLFYDLSNENQKIAMDILKVLHRAQRSG